MGNFFSLQITSQTEKTTITMMVTHSVVNTTLLPSTKRILKKYLPTILLSKCFNEKNLPFSKEVKKTEIGHLFEHILLEYLCELKLAKGYNEAIYAGKTKWNWKEDPYGTFHIMVNTGHSDIDILPIALERTINLVKTIYYTDTGTSSAYNYLQVL